MYSLNSRRAALLPCLLASALLASSCAHPARPAVTAPLPRPAAPAAGLALRRAPVHPKVVRPKVFLPIAFPNLDTSEISGLTFSPNGRSLAISYGTDAEVSLWNLRTGRLNWQRYVNAASGGPIQFGPNGDFLVANFYDPDDYTPTIISDLDGNLLPHFADLSNTGSAFLENTGRFLVVERGQGHVGAHTYGNAAKHESMARSAQVWDTNTWRRTDHLTAILTYPVKLTSSGKIIRHPAPVKSSVLVNSDGNPTGAWWKRATSPLTPTQSDNTHTTHKNEVYVSIKFDSTGNEAEGQVAVWDLRRRKHLWAQKTKNDSPRAPAISPNGKILAVVTLQGNVYFWNLRTGRLLAKSHCSDDVLRCLAFSPNGRVLAVAGGFSGWDGVRLLDVQTYKLFAVLKVAFGENNSRPRKDWRLEHPDWLAALPDLSYIASAGVIKKIRTPGRARDSRIVARFERPARMRAALRKCYVR